MTNSEQQLRAKIRAFLEANINIDDGVELADDDNIFAKGYVTSIFAMRLLNFIESAGAIEVSDDDVVLANFSTVDAMAALVAKYHGALA